MHCENPFLTQHPAYSGIHIYGFLELKASLEIINRTASGLITDIDRNYKALMKEHGLDKEPESLAAEPVQEITVQEPEPVSAPDNACIPDPAISVESMNAYGYTDANMLPLTKERALELMERDVTVYMLRTDNTEAMAFDADEIRSFDGIFGVEASEWETVKDRFVPQDYEKAFLDNPADSFAIYQLRDNDDTARLRYMNSEYLEKKGLSVQKENYAVFTPNSRSMQEQVEEKVYGRLTQEQAAELDDLLADGTDTAAKIRCFMRRHHLPFLATDRSVLNLPAIGKSMSFRLVGITAEGKRLLRFDHDRTRRHSPIIDSMGEIFIVENKSLAAYLRQLGKMGEDPEDYASIWAYTQRHTSPTRGNTRFTA